MTKKKMAIVALGAAVALSLSGCVKVVQNIVLHDDDTVSGEFVFALENQYAEGMSSEDILSTLGGDTMTEGMVNATTENYADGKFTGTKIVFKDEPLTSSQVDGSLTREGDTFVFDGTVPDPSESAGLTDTAVATLSITFPGEVTEHNGTLSGTTVTWDLFKVTEAPHAIGGAIGTGDDGGVPGAGGGGIPVWLLIVIGVALVGGILFFLSKRGKAPVAPAAAEATPTVETAKEPVATKATDKKATDKK